MKEGGWLDEYQPGGRVMPSETTQSQVPAYMKSLPKSLKEAKQKQKKVDEGKAYEKAIQDVYYKYHKDKADKGSPLALGRALALGVDPVEAKSKIEQQNKDYAATTSKEDTEEYLRPVNDEYLKEKGLEYASYLAGPEVFELGALAKQGVKKLPSLLKKSLNKKVSATPFKSEINWGKWNPETPSYPELINEYNAIEQSTKKAGTWMKNPDGSSFQGTPEQFIQQQSSYFKKAYPQGYDETFRGVGSTNTNPDFSKGTDLSYSPPELTGDRAIFTANYDLAKEYAFGTKNPQMLNPQSPKGEPGVFNLIHPKGKQIDINTLFDDWQNVDLRKANKAHLQAHLNNQKLHLQKIIDNPYADKKIIDKQKEHVNNLQKNIDEFDNRITDADELSKLRANIATVPSTDDIAAYLPKSDLRKVTLRNLIDGAPGDVTIVNNRPGNYLKSRIGNVGFFDMTNPNIYKALVPAAIATGAYQQQEEGGEIGEDEFRRGGPYTPPKLKKKAKKYGTSKNIQSSINKLFTRNYDVFGPGGKNIYNPNVYKTGGESTGWLDNLD
jgi:hypothetical protein